MSQIVIVSGPPGAGKSTVCEALCERYDRTVHLETDLFFAAIRMGFEKPWKPGTSRQNRMVTRAAARAATAYAENLYAVFIDAVVGRAEFLRIFIEELAPTGAALHLVTLLPDVETTVRRGLSRESTLRVPEDVLRRMHAQFAEGGVRAGCSIDNSGMTPLETADRVMDACGRGEALVWSPD